MKTNIQNVLLAVLLAGATQLLDAQGTAFTYQGQLNTGGTAATGSYDFRFKLYTDPLGNTQVGSSYLTNAIAVTNGLFLTTIDFGAGIFTGGTNWLEVDVRTNGVGSYTVLNPLQQLTPTPNAIFAETAGNVSGTLSVASLPPVVVTNGATNLTLAGTFTGNGSGLTNANAGTLNGLTATNFWQTTGNGGTTPGANYLGTADNKNLIVKVNNQQAVRYEPTTDTPSIVGGYAGNSAGGLEGVTIAGGGTVIGTQPNTVINNGHYGTIGGGYNNLVTNYGAGVFGGSANHAYGNFSLVGEGQFNTAAGNYSTVVGGIQNTIQVNSAYSVIAGGYQNNIASNSTYSAVLSGQNNTIATNVTKSVIAGGQNNTIAGTSATSFIVGGSGNTINDYNNGSLIGDGWNNTIDTNASQSVIGGGWHNWIQPYTSFSTIGGGAYNTILVGQPDNFIGGGISNNAGYGGRTVVVGGALNTATAAYAAVLGGQLNSAVGNLSTVGGGLANNASGQASFVGGGSNNIVLADRGAVAGGVYNYVDSGSIGSAIGGGYDNTINVNSTQAGIAGGTANSITNSYESFLGGGTINSIQTAPRSVVAGGEQNTVLAGADHSFIGAGQLNTIAANGWQSVIVGGSLNVVSNAANYGVIGGGSENIIGTNSTDAVIAGGFMNQIGANSSYSAVGGGNANIAGGQYSTIPGGANNLTTGNYSFAAGIRAGATNNNTFVWNDGSAGSFNSTTNNQFIIHATNGVGIGMNAPFTTLSVNGALGFTDNYTPEIYMYQTGNIYAGRMILAHSQAYPQYGIYYNDNTDQFVFTNGTYPVLSIGLTSQSVGIGTTSPNQRLEVNGRIRMDTWTADGTTAVYKNASGDIGLQSSDRRLKKNVETISNALEVVASLRGVTFNWLNQPDDAPKTVGFIAQEVQAALPELTYEFQGQDGQTYYGVHYEKVAAVLANAVNEQQARLATQAEAISELQQRLAKLEALMDKPATSK